MIQDETYWTIQSMRADTSEFVQALGEQVLVADENNRALIQQTWPGTWVKHWINGKRLAADHAAYLAELHANNLETCNDTF